MNYAPLLFLGAPGWLEILLILVVVLLLFGAKKLPEVMGSFGKGVKEFKKGVKDINRELDGDVDTQPGDEDIRKSEGGEVKERNRPPDGEEK
ncbi:MAG: twin-arginine translocase TatA/TatE family subunit [Candidatus Auribacterota bacterium]|nr:twin-arginine translocase TatA/TatE family subunit [Candidatus Auribacterota bacterium]